MNTPLRLLMIEDNEDDAELIVQELRRRGCTVAPHRVESLDAVRAALSSGGPWDVVLCDYSLPASNGVDVLQVVHAHDPDLPFIFVSGTIGEDVAVTAMRAGAHDYILKDNLTRLEPALRRELQDAAERREYRRTAQALQTVETRMRRVFDSSMIGLVFWRQDGAVLDANAEYLRLTGYTRDDLLAGRINWRAMVPPAGGPDEEALRAELETSGVSTPFELELITKHGTRRPVLIGSALLEGTGDEGAAFVMDMTQAVLDREARVTLENQLRQAQKMELVARLAGGVAHDFNNLLAVMLLSAGLARDEAPPEVHGYLADITQAAEEGAELTRQLLALGRRQALVPDLVDINDLVRKQESLLRRLAGEQVSLVLTLEAQLGTVRVDPSQLEQVILNLCVNARDAMPDGGTLTLHTANADLSEAVWAFPESIPPGAYVMLAVADTGVGMDRQTLSRIFEPFFSTKGEGRGTGLGLAVVHGILTQSGGHVAVYSERGRGTTFRVYLPRVAGVGAPLHDAGGDAPVRAPDGKVVLIAEDEATLRRAATQALQRCGYRVLSASNADEALRLASRCTEGIDLLVTDVVMPGMSGPQLFERLREARPEIRVLFTSGYLPDHVSRQGVEVLEGRFLPKPFTMADLSRRVDALLRAAP